MKVYVDELPKSCEKCGFCEYFDKDAHGKGKHEVACYFNGSLGNILYGNQTSPQTCPLQSLSDYTKQVRKEACEEIAKKMENKLVRMQPDGEFGTRLAIDWYDINKVLDQIQGE